MKTRIIVLLLGCAFAFASCGGSSGGNERDEAAIEEAIVAFADSDDPDDCAEFTTPRLLKKLSKANYEAALASCEALAVNPLLEDAKEVTVTDVEIDGDTATATASFVGSIFDGQTVRFGLLKREDRWMNDEIFGFVDLDAKKLATEWGRVLLLLSASPRETETATCVMNRLLKLSQANLESMYLEGDPDRYVELVQSCAGRSSSL